MSERRYVITISVQVEDEEWEAKGFGPFDEDVALTLFGQLNDALEDVPPSPYGWAWAQLIEVEPEITIVDEATALTEFFTGLNTEAEEPKPRRGYRGQEIVNSKLLNDPVEHHFATEGL